MRLLTVCKYGSLATMNRRSFFKTVAAAMVGAPVVAKAATETMPLSKDSGLVQILDIWHYHEGWWFRCWLMPDGTLILRDQVKRLPFYTLDGTDDCQFNATKLVLTPKEFDKLLSATPSIDIDSTCTS